MELKAMQTKRTGFTSMRVNGLLLILMLAAIPVLVSADGPVDLTLGNMGSFPWSVSGIVPGSSGSTFIELRNSGTVGGTLYIWIDNISETDPHGSGNALGNYMYFNVSHPRLSTSVPLPAHVYAYPAAPLRADYIIISPFPAGQTIRLNWTWEFRETGTPQNDAQEATLRFNISYMLVNVPPPPPPTTVPTIAPTPLPTQVPYYGGGGGGGGGHRTYTFTGPGGTLVTRGLPEQLHGGGLCYNVTQNYTLGYVGMLYNADDEKTLDLNISKAKAGGAVVTIDPDYIDVERFDSPGVLPRFWVNTSDIRNTTRMVKKVNSAELWTDPLVANLTTGTYIGSLHAVPIRIIPPSKIRITLTDCIIPEITDEIRNVSTRNDLEPGTIAYAMDVERFNLPDVGEANVTMTLPESWVDRQGGTSSVHIARISNEIGKTELLNTVVVGTDSNGNMIFRGDSPHGTALFAIFSARPTVPQTQEPYQAPVSQSPTLWFLNPVYIGFLLIILIMVLIATAAYYRSGRQKKT